MQKFKLGKPFSYPTELMGVSHTNHHCSFEIVVVPFVFHNGELLI